jgi:hypothetical protein
VFVGLCDLVFFLRGCGGESAEYLALAPLPLFLGSSSIAVKKVGDLRFLPEVRLDAIVVVPLGRD